MQNLHAASSQLPDKPQPGSPHRRVLETPKGHMDQRRTEGFVPGEQWALGSQAEDGQLESASVEAFQGPDGIELAPTDFHRVDEERETNRPPSRVGRPTRRSEGSRLNHGVGSGRIPGSRWASRSPGSGRRLAK